MPKKSTTKAKPAAKSAAKSHARAKGQTQISISLSEDLLAKIDQCAEADNRTRSNWIMIKLNKALEEES